MKRYALIGVGAIAALVLAFLAGRRTAPVRVEERVKIETKTVVDQEAVARALTEAKAEWERSTKTRTTTRIVYRDGKPIEKVVYVDRDVLQTATIGIKESSETETKTHGETISTTTQDKVTTFARPTWRLAAQAGWSFDAKALRPSIFGGELSRQVLGPLWLGAWARTDSTAGLSLALEW